MKVKGSDVLFTLQTYEDRLNSNISNNELSHKLSERLLTLQNEDTNEPKRLNLTHINSTNCTPPLPPPPPEKNTNINSSTISTPASSIASSRTNTLRQFKTNAKAPPVPTKCSVLSYNQNRVHTNQPPPCPTPDYDTLSLASTVSSGTAVFRRPANQKIFKDNKQMQSTDSYKSSNSLDIMPKHPSTNCTKTSTIRKSRPISVTIGEYPSMRKQPGKLDFIQNGGKDSLDVRQDESLGSRLTSELTQTLNRSNLRKRTESMENLLSESRIPTRIKAQNNGGVRISLNNMSKAFTKSTSDLTKSSGNDRYETMPHRRTSRITVNANLNKSSEIPSGILKNVAADSGKNLTAQKSITFGEMPILIKEKTPATT